MFGPLLEEWAVGIRYTNLIPWQVKDDLMLNHPSSPQDSIRVWTIILEGVTPSVRLSLAIHVASCGPLGCLPTEYNLYYRKIPKAIVQLWNFKAVPPSNCATIVMRPAIFLDRSFEGYVSCGCHVNICGTTVDHSAAEFVVHFPAVYPHRRQWHAVVACGQPQRKVNNGTCVVAFVVAAHNQPATPLCQAKGEYAAVYVRFICKKFLKEGPRATAWRPDAKNAIGLLCVKESILTHVAAKVHVDSWVMLDGITQVDRIPKPPAIDRGTLCVALTVTTMFVPAMSVAIRARDPLSSRALFEIKSRVNVIPTMPARTTTEGSDPTACVDDR